MKENKGRYNRMNSRTKDDTPQRPNLDYRPLVKAARDNCFADTGQLWFVQATSRV